MTEKELKARNFLDEPANLRPDAYNSFVVPYNATTQSLMCKKRNDNLIRNIRQYPAPISKTKV